MTRLAICVFLFSFLCLGQVFFVYQNDIFLLGCVSFVFAIFMVMQKKISTFLAIFIRIFAYECLVSGTVLLLLRHDLLPKFSDNFLPPDTLPLIVSIFGIITFLIAKIPLIKRITHIGDLYFNTHESMEFKFWFLPKKSVREAIFASIAVVVLVLINQGQVAIDVRLSYFSRDLYNALENKDSAAFWTQLLFVFLPWASIYVASAVVEYVITSYFVLRWRRWLSARYIHEWLYQGRHYRMSLAGNMTDNPDQRITEDIGQFINGNNAGIYGYSILFLSTLTGLTSYAIVLWGLSNNFSVPGTNIIVPGFLFWVALVYAALGTYITHIIGYKIAKLSFIRQRFEANFRFGLARLREYGEQIALLKGEQREQKSAIQNFMAIFVNYLDIVNIQKRLIAFTQVFRQISQYFPYIVGAPFYFSGKVTLGILFQTAGAFSNVQSSLTLFITYYTSLAEFKAVLERLWGFEQSIHQAERTKTQSQLLYHCNNTQNTISLQKLHLKLPNGQSLLEIDELRLMSGEPCLLQGPSGTGKSTLFRALVNMWPYGVGDIRFPQNSTSLLLPQKPYLPLGTLRDILCYPKTEENDIADETLQQLLQSCSLSQFESALNEDANWSQRLSGGEQQRLSLCRALLTKPDWLFLDEATSALDEDLEAKLYQLLFKQLPNTTIISIGHRSSLMPFHKRVLHLQKGSDGIARVQS